jgi:hypothetical protein
MRPLADATLYLELGTLFRLYAFVGTLSKSVFEASLQGPCQTL